MTLYRYTYTSYGEMLELILLEFEVIDETPKGYWISQVITDRFCYNPVVRKWVSKSGTNIFARVDKTKALEDFICRKKRQIKYITNNLQDIKTVLNRALKLQNNEKNKTTY